MPRFSCILSGPAARFVSLHRYRENGKRRDAPGSSLRASNARFHYRRPTLRAAARYCTLYSPRYADAASHNAAPDSTEIRINCENFGNRLPSLSQPSFNFSSILFGPLSLPIPFGTKMLDPLRSNAITRVATRYYFYLLS